MDDYQSVKHELKAGLHPEAICATCPCSRPCVQPPTMTAEQIDAKVKDASAKDVANDPAGRSFPASTLLTAVMYAGKDTLGQVCPVFALRLSGPDGRGIADRIREQMREWSDGS